MVLDLRDLMDKRAVLGECFFPVPVKPNETEKSVFSCQMNVQQHSNQDCATFFMKKEEAFTWMQNEERLRKLNVSTKTCIFKSQHTEL